MPVFASVLSTDPTHTARRFKVLAREPFRFILARHPGTYPQQTTVGNSLDWTQYIVLGSSAVIYPTPHAKLQPTQLHLIATHSPS